MRSAIVCFIVMATVLVPIASRGQVVPPRPGIDMPQAYYDRIAQDPTAFRFQKAWIGKARRAKLAREEFQQAQSGPSNLTLSSLPDAVRTQLTLSGTLHVPVILIEYANVTGPFPATQMEQQIFTGPTTSDGTVTDLYTEMSYGNLTLTGDVHGWVTANQNDVFYEGGCNGLCGSAKTGQLILEALQGVDGSVDFGLYDNDGPDGLPNSGDDDGFVDLVAIVHPETGGECGGSNMWSHRWVVEGWPQFNGPWNTNDPRTGGGLIKVYDYTLQPSKGSSNGCGAGIIEIGVFAHEFGHVFGLPDLYDTDGGGQGIGEHGLMGSGNWQNPPNPAHMCAWSKSELGWVSPIEVGPTLQGYNINSVEVNSEVYQLNVYEEKFQRMSLDPIAGSYSLHCGLSQTAANNRNWPGGKGYGNGWNEKVRRTFSYNGTDPVTLEYDVSYHTEVDYDFGYVKIDVDGTESALATYNGQGSQNNVMIDLTPYLSGSGVTEYQIVAQFESDYAVSDEDAVIPFNSGNLGPFKLDNISVTGGGESYSTDFETFEDGWCPAHSWPFPDNVSPSERFLVENRNKTGATFDQYLHGEGLFIWHIEENVATTYLGSSGGTAGTVNLEPAGVTLEEADGFRHLLIGANRGDSGDMYPGSTTKTTFDNTTNPNSKSYNLFVTTVVVDNVGSPGATMTADMRAGRFPPTLSSVTPNSGDNDQVLPITELAGTWLYKGGTFCLRDLSLNEYPGSVTEWVGKAKVVGSIDLNGVPGGTYDVVWKGPDGQEAVIANGFVVNDVVSGIGPVMVNYLRQNTPNPFNPTTTIGYTIGRQAHVTLRVFNVAGQLVKTLVDAEQSPTPAGFSVVWDGRNDTGAPVASGVYLYKLTVGGDFQSVRKLVVLK